jgi:hypothetical protein
LVSVIARADTHAATEVYWKYCFLLGPCKGVIRKATGATESVVYERV